MLVLSGFSAQAQRTNPGGLCGGMAGFVCGESEWCDYPEDTVCGRADRTGLCKPRPDVCIQIYQPVCGCDGESWSNACEASQAGVDVAYEGACHSSK